MLFCTDAANVEESVSFLIVEIPAKHQSTALIRAPGVVSLQDVSQSVRHIGRLIQFSVCSFETGRIYFSKDMS